MSAYFPLIGILTSKGSKKDSFYGDGRFLKGIQTEVQKLGGLSFIFTMDHFSNDQVIGYFYIAKTKKWAKATFPLPHVMYNRISSRDEELKESFIDIVKECHKQKIPFLNVSFFNKWTVYESLQQNKHLLPSLPKTIVYDHPDSFFSMLNHYNAVYFKPTDGHKGKGIFKIDFDGEVYKLYEQDHITTYSKNEVIEQIGQRTNSKLYIIQQEIHTDHLDHRKYDLRSICMNDGQRYNIIHIGVRKANKGNILTHVPNGGEIIPLYQVKDKYDHHQLQSIVNEIGKSLSDVYGFIGEFSLDIGLSENGHPYIFDVNSKPMIFDEDHIQLKRNKCLAALFHKLATITKKV